MVNFIDTYYDITCGNCARSRSTDFEKGMETRKDALVKYAQAEGWKWTRDKVLCPDCAAGKRRAL